MLTSDFYQIIDSELNTILTKHANDSYISKNKKEDQKKSYALLIWFLEFYGRNSSNYGEYITDRAQDNSCDILFDYVDQQGKKVFYIVQSKWNNAKNALKEIKRDDIITVLNDFNSTFQDRKPNDNPKLEEKLVELDQHLKANGTVELLFLSLSQYTVNADDNITATAFNNHNNKIKFELIDIDRIKKDYIDRKYKQIKPINPLEYYYSPEEINIELDIVQENGNFIKIDRPFEAYVVLLRPKTIFDLFDKYGFALFDKYVRNALIQSQFNQQIEQTVIDNPAYFWYYNNGITAITSLLEIGQKAVTIELTSLQIINGAQTIYAIYKAYKEASEVKRKQMDQEALITLRLLKSGGKDFDLNVTRFNNSQHSANDRDFCANDTIQIRLQNESYQTKFWYEKRRGEFRTLPQGVKSISNTELALAYLAYHLQYPLQEDLYRQNYNKINKNFLFISTKNNKAGLYEIIFNEKTKFKDMLCAWKVFNSIKKTRLFTSEFQQFYVLALFKIVFAKYFQAKFNSQPFFLNTYVLSFYAKSQERSIFQIIHFIYNSTQMLMTKANTLEKKTYTLFSYSQLRTQLSLTTITPEDIENIQLPES